MRAAARTDIGPGELADLLRRAWREALMAGWWAAVVDERALLRPLGEQLLASEMPFAWPVGDRRPRPVRRRR